jgi:isocitrate dehydrogenase kinase/phosphatase
MRQDLTDSELSCRCAKAIHNAFESYQSTFGIITQRAKDRFEHRDWHGMQLDVVRRANLIEQMVNHVAADINALSDKRTEAMRFWPNAKSMYFKLIAEREDYELAETFSDSIVMHSVATGGIDGTGEIEQTHICHRPVLEPHPCPLIRLLSAQAATR